MDPFPQEHWGKRTVAVISSFNGSEADGKKALAPLLDALPEPFFNWMGMMPFPAMQGLFDPFFPKGLQRYWKGDFVEGSSPMPPSNIKRYGTGGVRAGGQPLPFARAVEANR